MAEVKELYHHINLSNEILVIVDIIVSLTELYKN
jgi:hypothetical protein